MSRLTNFRSLSSLFFLGLVVIGTAVAATSLGLAMSVPAKLVWINSSAILAALTALILSALRAPKAAWLVGLLVWSGACQLWLSDGNWFKTYDVSNPGRLALLAYASILLQGTVSLIVLLTDNRNWLIRSIQALTMKRIIQLCVLFGCLAITSLSVFSFVGTYDEIGYIIQLFVASGMMVATMTGVLAVLFASDLAKISIPKALVARLDRFAFAILPIMFLVITILYAIFAFGRMPVVEDETAYLFQAQTIAGGGFVAPELPGAISNQMEFYLIQSDVSGWYATTVAGWPIVLSLGVLIGLPWLVNPVLGTLSVILGMAFWRRVTDRRQAIFVGILMVASPWMLQISVSWMTHALVLALSLGSWYLIALAAGRARYRLIPDASILFAAGLLMGWIFFTRALEGVIIGGLTGACVLWLYGRRRMITPILTYGLGCIATGSLYFLYNYHMTGDMLTTPLMAYLESSWGEGANAFGFGADIGPPEGWGALDLWAGHSPGEAILNLNNGLNALNTELFGWSMGSLLLVLVCVIWRRMKAVEVAMAALAGTVIIVHFFYWFSGTFYIGPRYWFGAFFAFIVLSAAGLDTIRQAFTSAEGDPFDRSLGVLFLVFCGFSITIFSTWRAVERYAPRTQSARMVANYEFPAGSPENAVIALPCQRLFDGAMHLNDPYLRENAPIYAVGATEESLVALQKAFPDRTVVFASDLRKGCNR